MGKLEELSRLAAGNATESIGAKDTRPRPASPTNGGTPARWRGVVKSRDAVDVPVGMIVADPNQPRTEFDDESLGRLAASLKERGQLQPIRVRWDEESGSYVVVVGERRWRAARLAGLESVACVVASGSPTAEDLLEDQLVENALREDLRPIEQAKAYRSLMEGRGLSIRGLAERLRVSSASISRAMAMLELPASVQEQVEQGSLSPAAAYEITGLDDPAEQGAVAAAVVEQGLSRSEVADVVRAVRARRPAPPPRPDPVTLDLGDGMVVTVKWRKANGVTAAQALKKAARLAQERERAGEAA